MLAILGPCAAVALVQMTPPITPLSPERIRALVKKLEEPTRHQTDQKLGPPAGPWPTFSYRWHVEEISELRRAGEAAVPALLALLEDKSKPGQARAHAVAVLAKRLVGTKIKPDPRIIVAINAVLADKDPALRYGTLSQLTPCGLACNLDIRAMYKKNGAAIPSHWLPPEELAFTPAVMDAFLPRMIAALKDESPEIVVEAAGTIYAFGRPGQGVSELLAAMGRKEPEVRAAVAGTLSWAGADEPEALKAVLKELDPHRYGYDWTHYQRIVGAVGSFGPRAKDAVPALIAALKDDRWRRDLSSAVYRSAINSLGKIGPAAKPAVPAILARLEDPVMSYGAILRAFDALDQIDRDAAQTARARQRQKEEEYKRWRDQLSQPPQPNPLLDVPKRP